MTKEFTNIALPHGAEIAGCIIDDQIASGSFGLVYSGHRAGNPQEKVAIKEFLPERLCRREVSLTVVASTDEAKSTFNLAKEKFISEAAILIQLGASAGSRNIVKVFGFAEQNNTAYMVMEFLPGASLRTVIKDQRSPGVERWVPVLRGLLNGLSLAHQRRIWHRDIKPDNIVFRSDGTPVLIDFGAARQDIQDLPATQHTFLTPRYAAPEQLVGDEPMGAWTDLYSLAATLYHAVTGEAPDSAQDRLMSGRDLFIDTGLANSPEEIRFIDSINKALNLDAGKRYQSALEWLDDLEGSSTVIVPVKPDRSMKFPLIIGGGLVSMLVAGGGFMLVSGPSGNDDASVGPAKIENASQTDADDDTSVASDVDTDAQASAPSGSATTGTDDVSEPSLPLPLLTNDDSSASGSLSGTEETDNIAVFLDQLQSLQCSFLQQADDQLTYRGFVSQRESLTQLQASARLAGVQFDEVSVIEPALCHALNRLNEAGPKLADLGREGAVQLNHSDHHYHDDESIEFTIRNDSDKMRHVILDYIDNEGNLVHITPGVEAPASLAPGASVTFGEDGLYTAGEPYGSNLIVLYLSENSPLADEAEPIVSESLEDYIERSPLFRSSSGPGVSPGGFITFATTPVE